MGLTCFLPVWIKTLAALAGLTANNVVASAESFKNLRRVAIFTCI
jgi:hypothetical protein